MEHSTFEFQRARGIVWVCDLANSSQFLNDDATAAAIEAFLPRFNWVSRLIVEAFGGVFVKWTGDGFLAWFPVELHRELGPRAREVFHAVNELTVFSNVTGLAVQSEKKFRLRHGVAFEQDALVTEIHSGTHVAIDLIGRAVVLAFRLSGVSAEFPGVVSQCELVSAAKDAGLKTIHFKRWRLSAEERLKYFKGENWGTRSLCYSAGRKPRMMTPRGVLRLLKSARNKAVDDSEVDESTPRMRFFQSMQRGPDWSRASVSTFVNWVENELLTSVESAIPVFEQLVIASASKSF